MNAFGANAGGAAAAAAVAAPDRSPIRQPSRSPPPVAVSTTTKSRLDYRVRGHARAPFAACLIAARMRGYVPQRQILPDMAASMSASLGWAFFASSADADMI